MLSLSLIASRNCQRSLQKQRNWPLQVPVNFHCWICAFSSPFYVKLLGDKIDEVVKEWDAQKEGFYERTGLSPGNRLMVIDNDESGVQYYEDGSRGSQLMVIDNDESGVQNHEDDDFDELDQLLE